jgi:hypothetical protein
MLACLVVLLAMALSASAANRAEEVPAKEPAALFEARLITPLSSYRSRKGNLVTATIATEACTLDGPLPVGTEIRGSIKDAHRVGLGLIHETAKLALEFNELRFPDGRVFPVSARVADVENARERIDSKGAIHGIRATATLSNRLGERLAFEAMAHPYALVPVFALETTVLHFPEPEIEYSSGTDLSLAIDATSSLGEIAPCSAKTSGPTSEQAVQLRGVVDALPYWTYSKRQPQAMDPINLIYVGSRDSLESAFAAAGWGGSVPNSVRAGVDAVRAIARESVYLQAPMRTLLLDDAEPQLRMQTTLNTFAKRDHLRIWKRESQVTGEDVWASAATRDTGVTFSLRPFGFTHKVEQPVDLERERVVRDLTATGCVDWVSYFDRPAPPPEPGAGPRNVKSDFRVAVVALNSCHVSPIQAVSLAPPRLYVRLIRRVTLTARNHLIRDNIFYRCGDAARIGLESLYHWHTGRESARKQRIKENAALGN